MSADYVIAIDGLAAFESLADIPSEVLSAATKAVNRTAERARTAGRREIQKQVNLPARYVSDNLTIGEPATKNRLEREIVGRFRPVSLARYAKGTPESTRRAGFVRLEMQKGHATYIGSKKPGATKAFLIRLRGIGGSTEAGAANIGLAVRLKPGETIRNKKIRLSSMKGGLMLLYGASVDQLFATIREDISPEMSDFLQQEFLRLVELDLK